MTPSRPTSPKPSTTSNTTPRKRPTQHSSATSPAAPSTTTSKTYQTSHQHTISFNSCHNAINYCFTIGDDGHIPSVDFSNSLHRTRAIQQNRVEKNDCPPIGPFDIRKAGIPRNSPWKSLSLKITPAPQGDNAVIDDRDNRTRLIHTFPLDIYRHALLVTVSTRHFGPSALPAC